MSILLLSACQFWQAPPVTGPPVCNAQHVWGPDEHNEPGEGYHLPHDALSPVVVDQSEHYTPDLKAWNALDTPITLRASGSGFRILYEEGGDANSGWIGLASITAAGHIKTCTVTMNHTLLKTMPPGAADGVSCMEIGHCLGLAHDEAEDSCMTTCAGMGRSEWLACLLSHPKPGAHDAEQLKAIYAHADEDPIAGCKGSIVIHKFKVPK